VLIAYLDEFGHVGPYIRAGHPKFGQHPVFGYAGYVIPAVSVRSFGARFKTDRDRLFKTEINASSSPHQWERKGSEYFSTGSIQKRPEQVRVFRSLVNALKKEGGAFFFYGDEKPRGTLKETAETSGDRTVGSLRETVNRLCTYAENKGDELLILMDAITEKNRQELVAQMYAHIFSRSRRSRDHEEMRRIVEAPLHIDSRLNVGVQFADWVCALLGRMSHWQLVDGSEFGWASERFADVLEGSFTYESKIHLQLGGDIFNSSILRLGERGYREASVGARVEMPRDFYAKLRQGVRGRAGS